MNIFKVKVNILRRGKAKYGTQFPNSRYISLGEDGLALYHDYRGPWNTVKDILSKVHEVIEFPTEKNLLLFRKLKALQKI